jgi:hypothetical protein
MGELLCYTDGKQNGWIELKIVKNLDFSNDREKLTEVFGLVQKKFDGILFPS